MGKRLFDILFAILCVLILSPLLALIALLVKICSPRGPVLYRSRRIGQWGNPFWLLKFRTMVINADRIGGPSTADNDPRTTAIGRFLRKYKLDELPQVFNVFRGEMSFVGPRPEVPQYAALLTERERAILSVPPGITDWATLWNPDEGVVLAGSADPERAYLEIIRPRKIALQLEYVNRHSFWIDLVIVFRTITVIVFRSAYRVMIALVRKVPFIGNELE